MNASSTSWPIQEWLRLVNVGFSRATRVRHPDREPVGDPVPLPEAAAALAQSRGPQPRRVGLEVVGGLTERGILRAAGPSPRTPTSSDIRSPSASRCDRSSATTSSGSAASRWTASPAWSGAWPEAARRSFWVTGCERRLDRVDRQARRQDLGRLRQQRPAATPERDHRIGVARRQGRSTVPVASGRDSGTSDDLLDLLLREVGMSMNQFGFDYDHAAEAYLKRDER